ncbi:hypothetical protein B0H34DRAFT_336587 [Crassisporium funariophilum]|nr:hypothetical protein B0H34DRAFT_336587 [Crassisporium funariophilum]
MSVIGTGFLRSTAGARFMGSFMVKESQYIVSGSFASSVPPFRCSGATLTCEHVDLLSGTKPLDGVIGCDGIKLNFEGGNKIFGKLDAPICPASSVCGTGVWTHS